MTMQKNRAVAAFAGLALLAGVGAVTIPVITATSAAPAKTVAAEPLPDTGEGAAVRASDTQDYEEAAQAARDAEAARIAAEEAAAAEAARVAAEQAAAQKAAAVAAAQNHQRATANSGKHPSGTPVTFVPSSDPQNANGGDYIDPSIFCESGSASTRNGVPVCD